MLIASLICTLIAYLVCMQVRLVLMLAWLVRMMALAWKRVERCVGRTVLVVLDSRARAATRLRLLRVLPNTRRKGGPANAGAGAGAGALSERESTTALGTALPPLSSPRLFDAMGGKPSRGLEEASLSASLTPTTSRSGLAEESSPWSHRSRRLRMGRWDQEADAHYQSLRQSLRRISEADVTRSQYSAKDECQVAFLQGIPDCR